MTPDELRTRLADAPDGFRKDFAQAVVHQISEGTFIYNNAIEMDGYDGVDGTDLVLVLLTLTPAQLDTAWEAARTAREARQRAERNERIAGQAIPGVPAQGAFTLVSFFIETDEDHRAFIQNH